MEINNIKQRLTNKVVWLTAIPIIANLIATNFSPVYAENFSNTITPIVNILAILGILNNPNEPINLNWDYLKEKFSSKVVWITIIPMVANIIAIYASQEYADGFANTITPIINLLAIFGILNNPNDKENF